MCTAKAVSNIQIFNSHSESINANCWNIFLHSLNTKTYLLSTRKCLQEYTMYTKKNRIIEEAQVCFSQNRTGERFINEKLVEF
jgi:alpha-galactosidase